jgi:hypothetical protein
MPRDRLAFAVFIGCQVELGSPGEQRLEPLDVLFLVCVDDVEGLEVVVDVDAKTGPRRLFLLRRHIARPPRQVADVADR